MFSNVLLCCFLGQKMSDERTVFMGIVVSITCCSDSFHLPFCPSHHKSHNMRKVDSVEKILTVGQCVTLLGEIGHNSFCENLSHVCSLFLSLQHIYVPNCKLDFLTFSTPTIPLKSKDWETHPWLCGNKGRYVSIEVISQQVRHWCLCDIKTVSEIQQGWRFLFVAVLFSLTPTCWRFCSVLPFVFSITL